MNLVPKGNDRVPFKWRASGDRDVNSVIGPYPPVLIFKPSIAALIGFI